MRRKVLAILTIAGLGILATPTLPASASTSAYCTHAWDAARVPVGKNLWIHPPHFWTAGDDPQPVFRCIMSQKGSKKQGAEAVMELQVTISQCYGITLDMDGSFGPATARALKTVQKRVGVKADGVYGPKTGAAMKWVSEWYGDSEHDDGSFGGCYAKPSVF